MSFPSLLKTISPDQRQYIHEFTLVSHLEVAFILFILFNSQVNFSSLNYMFNGPGSKILFCECSQQLGFSDLFSVLEKLRRIKNVQFRLTNCLYLQQKQNRMVPQLHVFEKIAQNSSIYLRCLRRFMRSFLFQSALFTAKPLAAPYAHVLKAWSRFPLWVRNRGTQQRFPPKFIENTFWAIQSTFRSLEIHSNQR